MHYLNEGDKIVVIGSDGIEKKGIVQKTFTGRYKRGLEVLRVSDGQVKTIDFFAYNIYIEERDPNVKCSCGLPDCGAGTPARGHYRYCKLFEMD